MAPILGIWASSASPAAAATSYESIATLTANGTFTSIPQTYKHLQIRYLARDSSSNTTKGFFLRFNGDTGANYAAHSLGGNGSSASAAGVTGFTYMPLGTIPANNATSNVFAGGIVDILDYTNTNKNTTVRALTGFDANGSGTVELDSGLWINTSAITSITCGTDTGNLVTGGIIALYGIKG
jgi:hypothetical protein